MRIVRKQQWDLGVPRVSSSSMLKPGIILSLFIIRYLVSTNKFLISTKYD